MFRGFKNAIKGGIGTVSEKSQDLASTVVNDQDFSTSAIKDKLKETTKRTYKEGKILYKEGAEDFRDKVGHENVDKVSTTTKDAAHNIKHYGAFGENLLGYSDPQKELRKAVKAKEKAAKKAKKAKKKKGEKVEDLFDPENLAKYKKELEEKRNLRDLAAPVSPGVTDTSKSPTSPTDKLFEEPLVDKKQSHNWSDEGSDDFDFGLQDNEKKPEAVKEEEEAPKSDWERFQALTSGVDAIVKQKKDDLDSLKVTSYYQRKKTQDEIEEDARLARPKNLVGKRKKRWVDLDEEGFEDKEGVIVEDVSDNDMSEEDEEEEPEKVEIEDCEPTPKEESPIEEIPSIEEVEEQKEKDEEEDNEDDIFNTEFVDEQLAVLDLKLNEIPDSPIDDGPDVFDTKFASDIVEKAEKERLAKERIENQKVKFGCIAAAADVLSGKASAVDKSAVEHTIRRRPRRGDIPVVEVKVAEETDGAKTGDNESTEDKPVISPTKMPDEMDKESDDQDDSSELDFNIQKEQPPDTSNEPEREAEVVDAVEEEEEEDDPFDAAFDELAKESLTKVNPDDIINDLFNEDLFDTTAADAVLNLASLTNVVEKREEEDEIILETFDDKDPFDTSAYDHITKDFEEDLEFECLAKRDPNETNDNNVIGDSGPDPFETVEREIANNLKEEENAGWAEFDQIKRKKPSRPPPPRPPPPRPPSRPKPPTVNIDYASGRNTPSILIKAPSTESVQSWNVTQSDTLLIKNNIEALEASALEDPDEVDPFDTSEFEGIVKELKAQTEDPFDTSHLNLEPSKTELKIIEEELIGNKKVEDEDSKDPFDTSEADKVVPKQEEPEDPFDTGTVTVEDNLEEDEDFDPFDTAIAEKVIPIRSPKISSKSTISIEDDDFDPSKAFSSTTPSPKPPARPNALPDQLVDPFASREGSAPPPPIVPRPVRPEHQVRISGRARPKTAAQIEAERQAALAKNPEPVESDDDFDPRADTPPTPKPKTPESPDPFDTDGIDPFDTSAVQIEE